MYKIGDKLKCGFDISGICKSTANEIYEIATQIATQRQQDKKYLIFDDNKEATFLDEDELSYFEKVDNESNKVKNPNSKHYELWHDLEAIDVIKTLLNEDEYVGFLKGNILKYQLRLGKKDNVEKEIEKIKDYQNELNMILIGDKSKT